MTKQIIIMLTVFLLATFINAQDTPIEFGEGAKIVGKSHKEIDEKTGAEIAAKYPEIQGPENAATQKFNSLAKVKVMAEVAKFRSSLDELLEMQKQLVEERRTGNYFEVGYRVAFANKDFVSISFGIDQYSGGAHPNSSSFSLNFDLKNGRELSIADLFLENSNYLRLISKYSINDLEKQIESPGDDWIRRGAGPKIENFESWTLSDDSIVLAFDAYQVASYVDGPQTVSIPYFKLRGVLRVFDFAPLQYANNGNPVNICRNGLFPKDSDEFKVAKVIGARNEKVNFFDDSSEICPGNANCKTRSYVIPGDEVIVSRTYGNYACSWFQPKKGFETVGWISLDKLRFEENVSGANWLGNWSYAENSINIARAKTPGMVHVTGNAFWKGLGDNIHIGEIDFLGSIKGTKMSLGEEGEYECRVKMQCAGKYLVVSDNLNCGGVNVSFNGVYRKATVN